MTTDAQVSLHPRVAALRAQREAVEKRAAQLKTQERDLTYRLAAQHRERERRNDTRRKILLGAMMLTLTAEAPELRAQLLAQLGVHLDRDSDRALFGLPPRSAARTES